MNATPTSKPPAQELAIVTPRKQQWEMLASHGHVLLAKVDVYRFRTKEALLIGAMGVTIALTAMPISNIVSTRGGQLAGYLVQKSTSLVTVKPQAQSPAPRVALPRVNLPNSVLQPLHDLSTPGVFMFDPGDIIPSLEVVGPAIFAQAQAMNAGQRVSECNFKASIKEPWFDGKDATPRCRYSKDGTRLWVWSLVKINYKMDVYSGSFASPFFGLLMKAKEGKVMWRNVAGMSLNDSLLLNHTLGLTAKNWLGMEKFLPETNPQVGPALDLSLVPRALEADFPELKK